jgi:hypothetical protein
VGQRLESSLEDLNVENTSNLQDPIALTLLEEVGCVASNWAIHLLVISEGESSVDHGNVNLRACLCAATGAPVHHGNNLVTFIS